MYNFFFRSFRQTAASSQSGPQQLSPPSCRSRAPTQNTMLLHQSMNVNIQLNKDRTDQWAAQAPSCSIDAIAAAILSASADLKLNSDCCVLTLLPPKCASEIIFMTSQITFMTSQIIFMNVGT